MFRLHRHKSDRLGERVEFKFSNFQAVKVPKGWDRLFVSIISVETGKTISKSSKALVRSGNCQWSETLSESIWISQDDVSKELEECLFKLVVSMGSARSGILGEAVLNLADYMSSRDSGPISLPLKKCNYGTILQLKVQCLNPKTKSRDEVWKETTTHLEDQHTNNDDMDNKSDGSDHMFNRSVGSSSSNHFGGTSCPDDPGNRASFSASGSHRSSDSGESSIGRSNLSPINSVNGVAHNLIGQQDSAGSHVSSAYGAGPGDDLYRSNPSSFNSRASGSSIYTNQWQENTAQTSGHSLAPVSLRPSDSSKDFLEAAEETIEELRDEAKMWERHARKLKLDLEILKKERSDQSKHQADLNMELSASYSERDSLKQEVEQLKLSLEELTAKQTIVDTAKFQLEDGIHMQKELEVELKFQKESNANLTLQLKKTQESNFELVSILQELEETIEEQRLEIAKLSQQGQLTEHEVDIRSQTSLDIEAEWACKLSVKEEEMMKLEQKLSDVLNAQHLNEMGCSGDNPDLLKEIDALKAKVQELERDCAELTDENLELIFKIKESRKDTGQGEVSHRSISNEFLGHISPDNSESEIGLLKSKIHQLEEELKQKEMFEDTASENLKIQFSELEKKCADLELELQYSKDQACDLDIKLHKSQLELEEKILESTELQKKHEKFQDIDPWSFDTASCTRVEKVEPWSPIERSTILSELYEQLHWALVQVKNPWYHSDSDGNAECGSHLDLMVPSSTGTVPQKELTEDMLNDLHELNALLRTKINECKAMFQSEDIEIKLRDANFTEAQKQLKDDILEKQELENLSEVKSKKEDTSEELMGNKSEMEELKPRLSSKEEIEVLRHSRRELEDLISSIQKEKCQLQENLEIALNESSITSKCLDDVRQDLIVLTSSMDSQVSANKMLERKSMELESGKHELELHISDLEQENVQLSERISGLEAQLRYLTNEKESNRLELEDSRTHILDLKDVISKKQAEIETQKEDLKQKLRETQKRLSEEQEESEFLKRSHSKLQGTVESLIEECSSLHKLTGDLRRQKLELHEHSTHLEVGLSESQKKNSDVCKKVEVLEKKLSSLQKDIASKEKSLISELETIFQEHKKHEEKISQVHIMLNQMDLEKTVEVENLHREVACLTAQASSTPDERERIASDAVIELSSLRSEKSKLESSSQGVHAKVKLYETELYTLRQESENKVQGLVDLLNASKQSEEMLLTDIEHMQRLMEDVKSSEEKSKKMANELELKLKASEYEKQQIMEEIANLKVQLQKISPLQDEIMVLKSSLGDAKFEKGKVEELLQSVSDECEELKAERISFEEKISKMQKALSDCEDDRRSRIALEEKLLRLEGDLTAREALYAHEAELKNELNRIKRANSQYQRKIQCLEEEKDELMKRAQVLEKELMLKKEENQFEKQDSNGNGIETYTSEHQETERQLQDVSKSQQKFDANKLKGLDDKKLRGLPVGKEPDVESKIHLLEIELAEALETNNMYKVQLKRKMLRVIDPAWAHGMTIAGQRHKIKCNYCGKIINGGITRLKEHLAHRTGQVIKCTQVPKEVKMEMLGLLEGGKKKKHEREDVRRQGVDACREEVFEPGTDVDVDEDDSDQELSAALRESSHTSP